MPFLSHAIPWSSLASTLEYRPTHSGKPGPQGSGLAFKGEKTQVKQLEYFARKLDATIEEHSNILRTKLKTAEQYKARAATWHTPVKTQGQSSRRDNTALSPLNPNSPQPEEKPAVVREAEALRDRQSLLSIGWVTPTETRPVFPSELAIKYDGLRKGEMTDLYEFRDIESWITTVGPDHERAEWTRARIRSDIVKLLIIEAAFRDDEESRDRLLDNAFLLLHRAEVRFSGYVFIHLWCCNIFCGIQGLGELALEFFIWIGTLESMIDGGEKRLLKVVDGDRGQPSHKAYMDLPMPYARMTEWHEHLAETVPFRMFMRQDRIIPVPDGRLLKGRLTTDVLADQEKLDAMKKWAWKTILIVDMLKREMWGGYDQYSLTWERKTIQHIDEVFIGQAMGMSFIDYEIDFGQRAWAERRKSAESKTAGKT